MHVRGYPPVSNRISRMGSNFGPQVGCKKGGKMGSHLGLLGMDKLSAIRAERLKRHICNNTDKDGGNLEMVAHFD